MTLVTGAALVVQGDALRLPLPDGSVDMICTSPPFWALRAYGAGPGEIGSEPTPQAFLEALWAATAEMVRVLKPSGSMFVDLGDKYAAAQGGRQSAIGELPKKLVHRDAQPRQRPDLPNPPASWGTRDATTTHVSPEQVPPKSLMLLPERYRIGCVDQTNPYYREQYTRQLLNDLIDGETTSEQARANLAAFDASPKSKGLGLIARSVIVWDKPNGLPESVQDRVRRSHEDWVHLTRQPRYYSALDEVREAHAGPLMARDKRSEPAGQKTMGNGSAGYSEGERVWGNPLGKLPGSVWTVPSEPLRLPEHLGVQHYAAFPSEWPRRLILGFSPPGICVDCNQGCVPVVDREIPDYRDLPMNPSDQGRYDSTPINGGLKSSGLARPGWRNLPGRSATILGYTCSCTPYTDHPGTGEPTGPSYAESIATIGYPDTGTNDNGRGVTSLQNRPKVGPWREYHLDGWKPPPTRPSVVLDPFGGTGTTAMVARALGRIGVSVDLSAAYGRAARWRARHDGAKAISRTNLERQGQLI